MKTTINAALVSILMPAAAFAQPISETEATISVYMRSAADFIAAAERAKGEFAELYPNVTIELRTNSTGGGWGAYIGGLTNQISAGNAPDIVDMAIEGFLAVSSKDLLLDLRPVLEADPDIQAAWAVTKFD